MKLTDEQISKLLPSIIEATSLKPFQVERTLELLQEGATVKRQVYFPVPAPSLFSSLAINGLPVSS